MKSISSSRNTNIYSLLIALRKNTPPPPPKNKHLQENSILKIIYKSKVKLNDLNVLVNVAVTLQSRKDIFEKQSTVSKV